MKLLYKPISLVAGVLAARAAKAAFQSLWSLIDDREPPKANTEAATLPQVVAAAVLEAATKAAVAAVVKRAAAQTFSHLFGVWPVPAEPRD
ncbi:MAG TPA: DUF4235 domain-containing protein [Solirubrobacteraceae bacterium]|nr:DUF4235 domain-containing protein [Solirubrobacteraceae bacterium]